jgi:clan AA aspartic protease (TIGR02281 family)
LPARFYGFLLLLLSCWPVHKLSANEFYRWFDEKGAIHFADNLHSVPKPYRNAGRESRYTPVDEKAIAASKSDLPRTSEPQRHVLPLTWEGGRLFVDARINDRFPIRCIVDTGANMTIIPASLASLLGFDKRNSLSIDIRGVGGVIEGRLIEVDSFKVGEAEAKNFDMIVIEDSLGGTALLGVDFLSRFRTEINYARGQMVLHAGDGQYDGYPAAWWQEKFRLYERLKRAYERRIGKNHIRSFGAGAAGGNPEVRYGGAAGVRQPVADEIKEHEHYLGILTKKIGALQIRANRVALPQAFRR